MTPDIDAVDLSKDFKEQRGKMLQNKWESKPMHGQKKREMKKLTLITTYHLLGFKKVILREKQKGL